MKDRAQCEGDSGIAEVYPVGKNRLNGKPPPPLFEKEAVEWRIEEEEYQRDCAYSGKREWLPKGKEQQSDQDECERDTYAACDRGIQIIDQIALSENKFGPWERPLKNICSKH